MIKRYFLSGDVNGLSIEEDPTGEWVKWEDAKNIIQELFNSVDGYDMDRRYRSPDLVDVYCKYLESGEVYATAN